MALICVTLPRSQEQLAADRPPLVDIILTDLDQIGTAAYRSKADIKLELVKRTANDPI